MLARYAAAAGMTRPVSPHQLRHFLFTWLKTQGIEDALIQPYSGHASRQSLEISATAETHGPAALVDRLALAQPMGRQLVDQALAGRELRWAEDRVTAARSAAAVIIQAPTASWEREIAAVADSTGLDESLLRTAVVDALDPDTEPLGRLRARDRRDDLDRGQHLPPTAADIAAVSASPATSVHRPQQPPADAGHRPAALAAARGRARR